MVDLPNSLEQFIPATFVSPQNPEAQPILTVSLCSCPPLAGPAVVENDLQFRATSLNMLAGGLL